MKKYLLHFALLLSIFALLPNTSSASLEIEHRGGWPPMVPNATILKGGSYFRLSFSIFNNSNTPVEGPTELNLKFLVEGNIHDSLSETVNRNIAPFESMFSGQGEALFFHLSNNETVNLSNQPEFMVALSYLDDDSLYSDTLRISLLAKEPTPTLDLELTSIETNNNSDLSFEGGRALFDLNITNVDPEGMLIPQFTPISFGYIIESNTSRTSSTTFVHSLGQQQNLTLNTTIPIESIEKYIEEKGSVDICFYLDFPLDVNPDNDTLCATYFLEGNTSREKPSLIGQLQHFPNPTNSHTQIQWHNQEAGQVEVQLLNLQGQVVLQQNLGHLPEGLQQFNLDLQAFPKGAYFYTLQLNGEIAHGKIIKQ